MKDLDVAQLCGGIYAAADDDPVSWDYLDDGNADDQICWATKRVGDTDVIVFRGSTVLVDWLRDFNAWADPFHKTAIGHVHPGFLLGIEQVWAEVKNMIGPKVIVAGHSLGAGRADILTGLMVRDNVPPISRIVFGEPRPGFQDFADLIRKVPGRSYCNGDLFGHDLITEVPFSVPPQNYVHPTQLISVTAPPSPNDRWGIFSYHHIHLYQEALAKL